MDLNKCLGDAGQEKDRRKKKGSREEETGPPRKARRLGEGESSE